MTAIHSENLTKVYSGKKAVDGLTLDIQEGELYALLGVNGAGKTTTLKILSCLIPPTSGDALLMGSSIVSQPQQVKSCISISPQETAVAQNLTVWENLLLIAGIYGLSGQPARDKAHALLAAFSLEEYRNQRAKTLSGGTQRRLSLALALISDPQILFLDEPTLGLDVLARRELWREIESLKGKITIILTTHYMEEAENLADRVGIMAKGRLVAQGTPRELMDKAGTDRFEDAFITLAGEANR